MTIVCLTVPAPSGGCSEIGSGRDEEIGVSEVLNGTY